jgi:hypothetical protein
MPRTTHAARVAPPRYRKPKPRRPRREHLPAIATALVVAAGAWMVSWWIVPLAALATGAVWRARRDVAQQAMWGAVAGWVLLLVVDSVHLRTWALARAFGGALYMPWGLAFVATLGFAAGLAWSGATLTSTLARALDPRSKQA